jgi:hypothetical protein
MSDWGKCKTCSSYGWLGSHKCDPVWEARIYGDGDDWYEVHASDAEDAAARFAEEYDQGGDYDIIKRGSAEVEVRKQGEEVIQLIDVTAESVPQYSAWERRTTPDTSGDRGGK